MNGSHDGTRGRFALCIRNGGYAGELEIRKIYEVLPDPDAERHGQIRVIDESGEDYLYPKSFFQVIELPDAVEAELLRRAS
jgi:hypothetical protein